MYINMTAFYFDNFFFAYYVNNDSSVRQELYNSFSVAYYKTQKALVYFRSNSKTVKKSNSWLLSGPRTDSQNHKHFSGIICAAWIVIILTQTTGLSISYCKCVYIQSTSHILVLGILSGHQLHRSSALCLKWLPRKQLLNGSGQF